MKQLYDHQDRAIRGLRQALVSGSKRVMLQAPTGFGKTVTAAAIIRMALEKGNRVIFTVPKIALVDQAVQDFWDVGIRDIGVIQADHPMTDPMRPVQVASLASLRNRHLPDASLVLIDEAHELHRFMIRWMAMDAWAAVPFIGLSATPWTKGLGRLYDRLIIAATTADLIDKGYLSPFKVYAPTKPDLSRVRTVAGDFHQGELSEAMQDKVLVADVVATWLRLGEGRPTLCFGVDRLHAKTLQAQFEAKGVSCGYVDAYTTREEREAVRRGFAAGTIKVVCNVGVLTTGVDWDVRCIVLARPTKSEILYSQIIGRGLRTAPGKDHCLILDHSSTTLNLGFVTDIRHDRLDDGKMARSGGRGDPERLPKECPRCKYVRPAKVSACPACGHVARVSSKVAVADGDLVDLSARRGEDKSMPAKVAFIAQLRAYAIEKGKSSGWVANSFRERFGVWPNDTRVRYAPPTAWISKEVRAWITAKAIRYAKQQQKRAS